METQGAAGRSRVRKARPQDLGQAVSAFRSLRTAALLRRPAIRKNLDERQKMSARIRWHMLERPHEPQRAGSPDQPEGLIDVAGRGLRPRRALEEERVQHPERIGDLGQSAGPDPVHAFFVFLHLLECDAERVRQRGLRHPAHQALGSDQLADFSIRGLWCFGVTFFPCRHDSSPEFYARHYSPQLRTGSNRPGGGCGHPLSGRPAPGPRPRAGAWNIADGRAGQPLAEPFPTAPRPREPRGTAHRTHLRNHPSWPARESSRDSPATCSHYALPARRASGSSSTISNGIPIESYQEISRATPIITAIPSALTSICIATPAAMSTVAKWPAKARTIPRPNISSECCPTRMSGRSTGDASIRQSRGTNRTTSAASARKCANRSRSRLLLSRSGISGEQPEKRRKSEHQHH